MAHGDWRIEVKLTVPAPPDELDRAEIINGSAEQIKKLRDHLSDLASQAVDVSVKSIRENEAKRKQAAARSAPIHTFTPSAAE